MPCLGLTRAALSDTDEWWDTHLSKHHPSQGPYRIRKKKAAMTHPVMCDGGYDPNWIWRWIYPVWGSVMYPALRRGDIAMHAWCHKCENHCERSTGDQHLCLVVSNSQLRGILEAAKKGAAEAHTPALLHIYIYIYMTDVYIYV